MSVAVCQYLSSAVLLHLPQEIAVNIVLLSHDIQSSILIEHFVIACPHDLRGVDMWHLGWFPED